jgi:ABC-type transport system involved in multi-copper enzyme maturation permease subunit
MTALVRAEFQKLFSTRLWWVMLLVMLIYTGVFLGFMTFLAGVQPVGGAGGGLPGRETPEFQQIAWSLGSGSGIFVMILGIVMMTSEYRYQTITSTFLTTPRRGRVVAAKLLAGFGVGVLFGVATVLLTAAVVLPAVALSGGEATVIGNDIPRISLGVVAGIALYGLFGIGLGALIRNQIGAIVGAVIWVFIVEGLLNSIPALQVVGKWTPGGAATALLNVEFDTGFGELSLLPAWAGAAVLVAYALIFSVVASLTTLRRDIT